MYIKSFDLLPDRRNNSASAIAMERANVSYMIMFTLGYLLGGVTALVIMGLAVAARQADSGHPQPHRIGHADERAPWRKRS